MRMEKKEKSEILKDFALMTQMLNDGVPISYFHIIGKTDLLLETIVSKNFIVFKNVLERGFDVKNGEFLYLHHAVRTLQTKFVKEILKKVGTDKGYVNRIENATGNNVLHVALQMMADLDMIMLLSQFNIDWNLKNNNEETPLCLLCKSDYYKIGRKEIKEIINRGGNFDIKNGNGKSALDCVVDVETKKIILEEK